MTSWPTVKHELNTTRDPNDPAGTDTWVDVTPYVVAFTTQRGRQDEQASVSNGQMKWKLRNIDGRFDPANASGPYFGNLVDWRTARTTIAWPASYVTDSFARANAATLGNADSGQAWTASVGAYGIVSNTANATALSSSEALALLTAGSTDAVASATVMLGDPGSLAAGVIVRATDASNFYLAQVTNTGVLLYKRVAGTYTQLGATFAHTLAIGDRIGVSANGTTISAVLNGVAVVTVTDSSLTTGTKAGLGVSSTTARLASFSVAPIGQVTYPLFYGNARQGFPQTYGDDGRYAWCEPVFVDAITALGQITLGDCIVSEMLADAPLALYRLGEAGGAYAGNISGTRQPNLPIVGLFGTPPTSRSASAAFGATSSIPTYSGTSLAFSSYQPADPPGPPSNYNGSARLESLAVPPVSSGSTFSVWTTYDGSVIFPLAAGDASVASQVNTAVGTSGIPWIGAYRFGGSWIGAMWDGATLRTTTASAVVTDGVMHLLALKLNTAGTVLTLNVDGVDVGSTAAGTAITSAQLTTVTCGHVQVGNNTPTTPFALFATYPSALSAARLLAHYTAGHTGFAGETTGPRVTRLLSYAEWLSGLESIDTTSVGELDTPLLGASGLAGQPLLTALQSTVDSASADLDISADGKVRYRSRDYRLLQTVPAFTFGEIEASGEHAYSRPPPTIGLKPELTANVIQVDQLNGLSVQRASGTSELRRFTQTYQRTVLLQDPEQVIDQADDLLRRRAVPVDRVDGLSFDPASKPDLWPVVLSLDFGLRIRVKRRPLNGAAARVSDCYVEGVGHDVTPSSWKVTVPTGAAPSFFPWVLGDATYGVLGSTTAPTF